MCIAKELDDTHSRVLSDAVMEQSMLGIGGEVCRISGKDHHCIKGMVDQMCAHQDLVSGTLWGVALESNFQGNEGFVVRLDDTYLRLIFSWKRLFRTQVMSCSLSLHSTAHAHSRQYSQWRNKHPTCTKSSANLLLNIVEIPTPLVNYMPCT